MRRSERAAEVARMPGRVTIPAPVRRPVPAGVGGGSRPAPDRFENLPDFDESGFEDPAPEDPGFDEAEFTDALDAAGEPAGMSDSLATLPEPGEELELDDVDLAELETGDGLGELEVLVGLTDLVGRDGPFAARCLAAA
jgi:hypothetical protein